MKKRQECNQASALLEVMAPPCQGCSAIRPALDVLVVNVGLRFKVQVLGLRVEPRSSISSECFVLATDF